MLYDLLLVDGIKGKLTQMIFTSVILLIILVMNIILYSMTWLRIKETDQVKRSLGTMSARIRATHRAAKALFVLAFFIQW